MRDIDFEPSERALREQRDLLECYPDARAVRAKKWGATPGRRGADRDPRL